VGLDASTAHEQNHPAWGEALQICGSGCPVVVLGSYRPVAKVVQIVVDEEEGCVKATFRTPLDLGKNGRDDHAPMIQRRKPSGFNLFFGAHTQRGKPVCS